MRRLMLVLSACGNSSVRVEIARPPIQYLTCKAEPLVPVELTDATVSVWTSEVVVAGRDCRSRLQAVKEWSEATANSKQ